MTPELKRAFSIKKRLNYPHLTVTVKEERGELAKF